MNTRTRNACIAGGLGALRPGQVDQVDVGCLGQSARIAALQYITPHSSAPKARTAVFFEKLMDTIVCARELVAFMFVAAMVRFLVPCHVVSLAAYPPRGHLLDAGLDLNKVCDRHDTQLLHIEPLLGMLPHLGNREADGNDSAPAHLHAALDLGRGWCKQVLDALVVDLKHAERHFEQHTAPIEPQPHITHHDLSAVDVSMPLNS